MKRVEENKITLTYGLVFIIILIAAFIRFYRLSEMAGFDFDQESASNIAYSIIRESPFHLLGQELTVKGIYMGPWYYYFLVPFYLASNLHPIGGFIASVLTSLVIIYIYFWLGRKLFGAGGGIIAAFLRAITFEQIIHDWSMIPSYACELLVLITWYCLYQLWNKKQDKYLPLLALMFGLYPSVYPVLFPFYFIFIILIVWKKIHFKLKTIITSIITFIIPLTPTIVFEIKYNFRELKRFIFLGGSQFGERTLGRFIYFIKYNLFEIDRILDTQFLPKFILIGIFLIILILLIKNKLGFWKKDFHKHMLLLTYSIVIACFSLIPAHVSENYFISLTTLVFLYLGGVLSYLTKNNVSKIILTIIILNIVVFNFKELKKNWDNPSLSNLYQKEQVVKEIIRRSGGKYFYVSIIHTPGWELGFNYLFSYYGHPLPKGPAKPPVYTIVIPKYLSPESINVSYGNIGLIFPDKNGY